MTAPVNTRSPDKNPNGIVLIGGDRYDTFIEKQLVQEITVELATDESSEGVLRVFDPDFGILDRYSSADGVPELEMLFYLGFGLDLGPPVFKGLLERVHHDGSDTVFIAYDMSYRMRRELKAEYHKRLDDVGIIRKLAERNGLLFEGPDEINPPLDTHPSMIQDSKNDWEHSLERARDAGFNIYVRHDTLFCKEPAKLSAPILSLIYRKDFLFLHEPALTYKTPENEQGRPKIVEQRGRHRGGRRLTGRSREHRRGHKPTEIRKDMSEHTPTWVKRRAHAQKEQQREPAWKCRVQSIPPLPVLRPDVRNTIELLEVGKLFSGPYLCDRVRHTLSGGGAFATEYELYRDVG